MMWISTSTQSSSAHAKDITMYPPISSRVNIYPVFTATGNGTCNPYARTYTQFTLSIANISITTAFACYGLVITY